MDFQLKNSGSSRYYISKFTTAFLPPTMKNFGSSRVPATTKQQAASSKQAA
jgi:hypothetical protein